MSLHIRINASLGSIFQRQTRFNTLYFGYAYEIAPSVGTVRSHTERKYPHLPQAPGGVLPQLELRDDISEAWR